MLAEFNFNFNSEFIKYIVVAATSPWWLPFFKALVEDFNDALRDEGGLLGYAPTDRKLEELRKERGSYESVLVNEPYLDMRGESPYRKGKHAVASESVAASNRPRSGSSRSRGFSDPKDASRRRSGFR